jgi:hypothetical protein
VIVDDHDGAVVGPTAVLALGCARCGNTPPAGWWSMVLIAKSSLLH